MAAKMDSNGFYSKVVVKAGAPAAGDFYTNTGGFLRDTSSNQSWVCMNYGGVLYKVQLT
ncbi:MAG: hypothetical protein ABI347_10770 [Nitrososphaera sp.]|jgi:hypothetical protein